MKNILDGIHRDQTLGKEKKKLKKKKEKEKAELEGIATENIPSKTH